jgi:iron complex transport system substrate-binding protein
VTRAHLYNAVAVSVALATSVGLGVVTTKRAASMRVVHKQSLAGVAEVTLSGGGHALRDGSGTLVPLIDYRRIASATTLSDAVLWELCEHERIVAYTARSSSRKLTGYRYAGKAGIESLSDVESMLALKPDLLIVNHYTDPGYIAHLRDKGIAVFDLGEMRGLSTLTRSLRTLARIVGHVELGERMAERIERGMRSLAADIPEAGRARALYLSSYGSEVYSAGDDTSYHDVLVAAGLRDAASGKFRDFPALSAEQMLALDPDLIVTKTGMGTQLCQHFGLQALRACQTRGSVIELDPERLDDPGAGMLEAAETLFSLAHPGAR